MRLTLAEHTIDELTIGTTTELDGSRLRVDLEELHSYLLEDRRLESVDMDLVNPGDKCRAGYVFDIVEPRAKEPGSGADFPGILGPFIPAGQGTTHVLKGAAVTVVDGDVSESSRIGGVPMLTSAGMVWWVPSCF